jgi:hypothetical protein
VAGHSGTISTDGRQLDATHPRRNPKLDLQDSFRSPSFPIPTPPAAYTSPLRSAIDLAVLWSERAKLDPISIALRPLESFDPVEYTKLSLDAMRVITLLFRVDLPGESDETLSRAFNVGILFQLSYLNST